MCGGLWLKIFVPGVQVNVNQDVMNWVLANGSREWPDEFNGREYQAQDVNKDLWALSLKVQKCVKREFVKDMESGSQTFTYVLVYPDNFDEPEGTKNCVYAEKYKNGFALCLNNSATDPTPKIPLFEENLQFYRLSCCANKFQDEKKSSLMVSPEPCRPIAVDLYNVNWHATEEDVR